MTPASVAAVVTTTTELKNALIASSRAESLHSCCFRVAKIKSLGLSWGRNWLG